MIRYFILLISVTLLLSCDQRETVVEDKTDVAISKTPERLLRHIVLFKFKESASSKQIKEVETAFTNLPSQINEIHHFEWGINNSPEELNKEFTHSFVVTFKSEADREVYLPHPAHLAFVEVLKPHLDDVLVIDYWTGDL